MITYRTPYGGLHSYKTLFKVFKRVLCNYFMNK